jgi:hypothetical protein
MSELQLALLVAAGVVLLALFAYGKWQERRSLRQFSADLRAGAGDALLDSMPPAAGRFEPRSASREPRSDSQVGADPRPRRVQPPSPDPAERESGAGVEAGFESRFESRFESDHEAESEAALPLADDADTIPLATFPREPAAEFPKAVLRERRTEPGGTLPPAAGPSVRAGPGFASASGSGAGEWVEDPLLDFAVELRCAHAVDGVAVYDAATRLAPGLLATPVHLVVWDARAQQWLRPDRFGFYSDVLVAAQLASRRHTLGEAEIGRLVGAMQQVARALDADFDQPDVGRVATQAAELDSLCSRFDIRIGLTLESTGGALTADRLVAAADAADLKAIDPLRWIRSDEAGRRLFTVAAPGPLAERLLLELDVPTAPADADPLRQLFAAGLQMGTELGARLVDDNGRVIDATSVAAIETQLKRLYGEMRSAGIEPAGLRAQRLYG